MRVMLLVPNLGGGGAERTMLNICTHLDRRSFEPVLVMGEQKGPYCSQIPRDILAISMDEAHVRKCVSKLANIIRIIKPDIVLSTLTHMNIVTIAAHSISKSASHVLVREPSVYSKASTQMRKNRRRLLDILVRTHYRKADRIIFLSEGAATDFGRKFSEIDNSMYRVVHNPVDLKSISKLKQEPIEAEWWPSDGRTVVAAGRLSPVKGYSYLFEAMQIVSRSLPDTRLVVMGLGEEEEHLREYARQLGISESVEFAGFQDNPFKYMAKSDVFVLSSLWEGFAHVIVEAFPRDC
jgi:glycosyltransferase involved in cell wall biosynthesis